MKNGSRKLIEMGERMDLKGTDLQAFVNEKEKQALEREERAQRREEEKNCTGTLNHIEVHM